MKIPCQYIYIIRKKYYAMMNIFHQKPGLFVLLATIDSLMKERNN